ncbi:MAG: branched-chain amino acid ABC transporter permease [Okeania sp. SIO2D1]|nr:branched-chain amino acid ABC transporter permease [Okeania sp. SIO2D1]
MNYLIHILILIEIYYILATALNLIAGYTGLLSIAQAAFYGVGAYIGALMALNLETPLLANLFCAALLCALFGILLGLPSLRIRDDYFTVATLAFQIIIFNIMNNWVSLTGGPLGIAGIPEPNILGWNLSPSSNFLLFTTLVSGFVLWLIHRLVSSPFGRVLKAIREDELFALSLGKNIAVYKLSIFVLGAGLAGIAGVLYAYYISFIDPFTFTVSESVLILAMVIIGGAGMLLGPIVGATLLIILPELLRFVGLPIAQAAYLRQILYGSLMVGFLILRPQGLAGYNRFGQK